MKKKRIIILGAGISGLSCAWYLSQLSHLCEFIVLEKGEKPGGYLQTEKEGGFLFEKGARTFKISRSFALLELALGLGIQEKQILADASAEKRYLWLNGKMQKFPKPVLSFSLLKEWFVPSKGEEEETIYDFGMRRFNKKFTDRLLDPLTLGIYAGDIQTLSINSCFPYLKNLEQKYGSILKGTVKEMFKNPRPVKGLFSFVGGMQTLVDTLHEKLQNHLHFKEEVFGLEFSGNKVAVKTTSGVLEADYVISALPVAALAQLFHTLDKKIGTLLQSIKSQGLVAVQLGFKEELLPFKGFGYLVPSSEKQTIYGVTFDSAMFPQHNQHPKETRMTVMLREVPHLEPVTKAIEEVGNHLKLPLRPDLVKVLKFTRAIPQLQLGHQQKIQLLRQLLLEKYPLCRVLGNYLTAPSVNDCVLNSRELVIHLEQEFLSRS